MTPEEYKKAACEGKDPLPRDVAQKLAKRQRKKKGAKVDAYKCQFCAKWHIGLPLRAKADRTPRGQEMDIPTPERKKKGEWVAVALEKNGPKAVRDMHAHPVDRLQHSGQITPEQAAAAYDYEKLYRASLQTPQARDSMTLWEPKGHESDDGNPEAVKRYRDMCRKIGMIRERQLQWVCVELREPIGREVGQFREALNEASRYFGYGLK